MIVLIFPGDPRLPYRRLPISSTATPMRIDNTSAISLSTDAAFHARVKHIDIKWHFLREVVTAKSLSVSYVNTHANVADAFTKPLERKPFTLLRRLMGVGPPCEEESSH